MRAINQKIRGATERQSWLACGSIVAVKFFREKSVNRGDHLHCLDQHLPLLPIGIGMFVRMETGEEENF